MLRSCGVCPFRGFSKSIGKLVMTADYAQDAVRYRFALSTSSPTQQMPKALLPVPDLRCVTTRRVMQDHGGLAFARCCTVLVGDRLEVGGYRPAHGHLQRGLVVLTLRCASAFGLPHMDESPGRRRWRENHGAGSHPHLGAAAVAILGLDEEADVAREVVDQAVQGSEHPAVDVQVDDPLAGVAI